MRLACERIARLWLTLGALTLFSSAAFAQPPVPNVDSQQAVPPSPVAAAPAPSASLVSAVRSPCDPDYWIVSTRHARYEIEHGQSFCYQVFRFDGHNPGRDSNLDELLSSLEPGIPVCIMTHGSFVTWESMLVDSAGTYHWLRSTAPCSKAVFIFYTWSSEDGHCLPQVRVNRSGRHAALNGFYLADLISKISPDHPVCMIGHSHGTRMVAAALHSMSGGTIEGKVLASNNHASRRIRVVMAAAAMDHTWLNPDERYGQALCSTEALINLSNKTDFPLWFYPLRRPFAARALAITGIMDRDRAKIGEMSYKLVNCDVSDIIGYGHYWGHYYNRPEIACAIRNYVFFDEQTCAGQPCR